MRPGPRFAADLLTRMREVAAQQLGGLAWQMETGGVAGPFPLEFEREVLLLFKEALHNIRKHAHARSVALALAQTGRVVSLTIADDGQGFDIDAATSGAGLASMRHRASQLGAQLTIRSQPGSGTEIKLEARLP
jgi:signal transduction histidine kinase